MARHREYLGWEEMKVHNGIVLLRDGAKRVYEVQDLGGTDKLRKLPDPPPIRRRPA